MHHVPSAWKGSGLYSNVTLWGSLFCTPTLEESLTHSRTALPHMFPARLQLPVKVLPYSQIPEPC